MYIRWALLIIRVPLTDLQHLTSSFHRERAPRGHRRHSFRLILPKHRVHVRIIPTPPSVGEGRRYQVKGLSSFIVACRSAKSTEPKNYTQRPSKKSTESLTLSLTSIPTFSHRGHKQQVGPQESKKERRRRGFKTAKRRLEIL